MKKGAFRQVWLTDKWAIKIPRFERFKLGLVFNQREVAKWKEIGDRVFEYKGGSVRLCPILFYLPLGLLVVMRRAAPLPDNHFQDLTTFTRTQFLFQAVRDNITEEDYIKTDTYGFLDGDLVVVDYAGCGGVDGTETKTIEYNANKWGKW